MPVPATTGQLRTRVTDMEVGDYIISAYTANPYPQFSYLGNKEAILSNLNFQNELPVTGGVYGESTQLGHFYFIKVAKGLLVADRVCQSGYACTWNWLNQYKFIQGVPWNSPNLIPTMTSNTSPSGVASASGVYGVKEPYRAFNKTNEDPSLTWTVGSPTGWIAYEFPVETVISGYSIKVVLTGEAPKTWTYEAWDGVNWVELDRRSNITNWVSNTKKTFYTSNTKAYVKYRINISAGTSPSYISVDELEMFETTGTIRSLTGGVAYADASGNKSLSDQNKGAWPTNNEWDTYIVNFPPSLIQSGRSLDDVFHNSGVITLTQDTPVNGLGSSTKRVARGNNGMATGLFIPESNSANTNGFRPAFEYIDK